MTQPVETRSPTSPPVPQQRALPDPLLLFAVLVSGASVMVVEVLGSRVLGPFFGVGLFVWSALLVVTLTALALGYYLGGVLADRRGHPALVYAVMVAAGCLVAVAPLCSAPVLRLAEPLGVRLGTLLSAAILFGPALTAMGMTTTIATRQAGDECGPTGRTVGLVYAVSTLGGLAGTLLAGFVLVPRWAVPNTLAATAAAELCVGLVGLSLRNGSKRAVLTAVLPLLALGEPSNSLGGDIEVLERSESLLGRLSVVRDDSRGAPLRLLRVDHSFVGGTWLSTGEPAFSFVHILEAVRLARPEGRRLLQIGLGIGSLSTSLGRAGVETDVIEIDPEIIRLARVHFGFEPSGAVYAEDARTVIRRLTERYDFIAHDTFTGGAVPEHLLSLEVLLRLKELLVPGGVLALNVVGAEQGPLSASTQAVNRTLREVFPHVRAFRDGPPGHAESPISNIIFFASDEPLEFGPRTGPFDSDTCRDMLTNFERWEVLETVAPGAQLVTDAHNPLGRLALPVIEAYRAAMNRLYPTEFWLL